MIRLKLQLVDMKRMEERPQKHKIKTKMEATCETGETTFIRLPETNEKRRIKSPRAEERAAQVMGGRTKARRVSGVRNRQKSAQACSD